MTMQRSENGADTAALVERLGSEDGLHESIPGGTVHVDRPLPFICVVREPLPETTGLDGLVSGLGSYIVATDDTRSAGHLQALLADLVRELADRFGAVLVLELWPGSSTDSAHATGTFRLHASASDRDSSTVACFVDALRDVEVGGMRLAAEAVTSAQPSSPHLPPLMLDEDVTKTGCVLLGLEVPPLYVDPDTGRRFPLIYRNLQRSLASALQRAFFEFATVQTSFEVKDFRALGPRSILEAARDADERLADIAAEIDFLLMVTPVDTDRAWADFQSSNYDHEPAFHHRPLPYDPDVIKRRLFDIELEAVDDPTLLALFRAKRRELDRQVSMLEDRDTPAFLPGSVQLYGGVDHELFDLARTMLERVTTAEAPVEGVTIDAPQVADRAREELDHYRRSYGELSSRVEIRDDIPGMMVDQGHVYVSANLKVASERVDALIQHEVGTHVVTHANGGIQPLKLFRVGLPGYEETQEGLATLAEYLVGGLNRGRLATLAARVIAVRALLDGASFVETFRVLHEETCVSATSAFNIAMRVHRSGGLTKDAIYLRGLDAILAHVASGGELDPLLVGKFPLGDVGVIEELLWRGVLQPPKVRPRWLDAVDAKERLAGIKRGKTMADLVGEVSP